MAIKFSTGQKTKHGKLSSFLGGIICLSLSATGFYVVFSGKPVEGGIPFLPDAVNSIIGITAIGSGAFFTGLLGIYAFYEFFKKG